MSSNNCVFCQIIKRELPACIFYEDDEIIGFMNHKPVHPGECLFIPKVHTDHFMDIDDNISAKMMRLAQKLSRYIRKEIKPQRVGYVVAGYGVAHAHLIVIPQYHTNDITCQHFAILQDNEITFTDEHIPVASKTELDSMAEKLKNFVKSTE